MQKTQNPVIIAVEKAGFFVFSTQKLIFNHILPKYIGNTLGTLLNQSLTFKNIKNHFKTHNQPKTKNLLELKSFFFGAFKARKHIRNSSHYMDPFDIKIDPFFSQNCRQHKLSLSTLESDNCPLSSTKKKTKKYKKEVWYQD